MDACNNALEFLISCFLMLFIAFKISHTTTVYKTFSNGAKRVNKYTLFKVNIALCTPFYYFSVYFLEVLNNVSILIFKLALLNLSLSNLWSKSNSIIYDF